jgi:hypothetical protein
MFCLVNAAAHAGAERIRASASSGAIKRDILGTCDYIVYEAA